MSAYLAAKSQLQRRPATWLVTGAAGFIASNIVEHLLKLDQTVIGFDDFSTGHSRNLDEVKGAVTSEQWNRFRLITGSIVDQQKCLDAAGGVDFVLHHAAVGSVPRSIDEPLFTHAVNVTGTINLLLAAKEHKAKRFVYASSSAVYGDDATLPKTEAIIGNCLSPYATTKLSDELYAQVFGRCYGIESVGLRYFNIFGPRQDPNGAYAAVIPKWIAAMLKRQEVTIFGDGLNTRDFCFVSDVVQANILAALTDNREALGQAFNVGLHGSTSLNDLFELLRSRLQRHCPWLAEFEPTYRPARLGDIRHSEASIDKAQRVLGYCPEYSVAQGLDAALDWYRANLA